MSSAPGEKVVLYSKPGRPRLPDHLLSEEGLRSRRRRDAIQAKAQSKESSPQVKSVGTRTDTFEMDQTLPITKRTKEVKSVGTQTDASFLLDGHDENMAASSNVQPSLEQGRSNPVDGNK